MIDLPSAFSVCALWRLKAIKGFTLTAKMPPPKTVMRHPQMLANRMALHGHHCKGPLRSVWINARVECLRVAVWECCGVVASP